MADRGRWFVERGLQYLRLVFCLALDAGLFAAWAFFAWLMSLLGKFMVNHGVDDRIASIFPLVSSGSTLVLAALFVFRDVVEAWRAIRKNKQ